MRPIITVTTDFGTQDGYVGEMKGVLLARVPDASIVDITHDVPPHDVESARLLVARVWLRFPVGTVHLVVVDPGVGSRRAALAVQSQDRYLVGPDNGSLSAALLVAGARVVELPVPASAAPTFHGRDVFAPAAAALVEGAAIDGLGLEMRDPVIRRTPEPVRLADGGLAGEIIAIDRFGNAITNLVGWRGGTVIVGAHALPVRRTYADADDGAPLALVGSSGFIEVALRNGNAARELGLTRGVSVVLRVAR
jgi:S-adenosyl-L-methionine hydrolase (adenosine-forming)